MFRMKPGQCDLVALALAASCLATGWSEIPDAMTLRSRQAIRSAIQRAYPVGARTAGQQAYSFGVFLEEMKPSDFVVTPDGGTVHIGTISGEPFYQTGVASDSAWRRSVAWRVTGHQRDRLSDSLRRQFCIPRTAADLTSWIGELENICEER